MAIKLNLLPQELAVDKTMGMVLKTTRAIGIIVTAIFIFFTIGVGVFLILSSTQLNNTQGRVQSLKSQIGSLEKSEQEVVLVKDRLKKISKVMGIANSSKNLGIVEPLLSEFSEMSKVTELNVDPSKISVLINFRNNQDMAVFFKQLNNSVDFKSAVLSSYSFNPLTGYLVGINMLPDK